MAPDAADGFVDHLKGRAKTICPTIAYVGADDPRVSEAVERVAREGIARPVLVGLPAQLPESCPPGVRTERVEDSERLSRFVRQYCDRRGVAPPVVRRLMKRPLLYAGMMVAGGEADAMVAGSNRPSASVFQAAGLTVGYQEGIEAPSTFFIMVVPRLGQRRHVPLIFADCALNVQPDVELLAQIAVVSARSARRLLGVVPRVALLSFSTHGSAAHARAELVRRAARLARDALEDGFVDGELQLDAALAPEVARRKVSQESEVAGRANVLVFPDLNAGNIAYKAVQYLGGALALGPMSQGFARPVSDLSRGCSVDDIVCVSAVTALQV